MTRRDDRPLLLVVGTGARAYREYVLRSVAERFRVWQFGDGEPGWEAEYLTGHTRVDTADPDLMLARAAEVAPDGVLTWDDTRVVQTAQLAEALALPGSGPEAALACRDKHRTRAALAEAGVPQAASVLVTSLPEARAAAERIGYPVVLKPQALNGSIGVVRVDGPDQIAGRFRVARAAAARGTEVVGVADGGVLVEEYLDGPEISVDAAWVGGAMLPAFVARKQVGFPPYFEEVGHVVDAADPLLTDPVLLDVVSAAHRAVGFGTGWTHTELRLTGAGPKVVEINARLGGDRIPQLGLAATGVDAPAVAAALACGERPELVPVRARAAAIRFLYPPDDGIVRAVQVDPDRIPATVDTVEVLVVPGQDVALPPAGHVSSRYALLLATADSASQCLADLSSAAEAVRVEMLRPRSGRR